MAARSTTILPYTEPFLHQLDHYTSSGYNSRFGDFIASEKIFNLTYELSHSVPWPVQTVPSNFEKLMYVPDQFSCDTAPDLLAIRTTHLYHHQKEYNYTTGIDVSVKRENGIGEKFVGIKYDVALKSNLFFSGNLFTDTTSSYALNSFVASVLRMHRQVLGTEDFTAEFKRDVSALPLKVETLAERKGIF